MSEKKTKKAPKKAKKTTAKKSAQPLSVKQKLIKYLRAARVFRPLVTIYAKVGAKTKIQKAGVRGVLNKDHKDHGLSSTFERNTENRGEYRIRGLKKVESKAA
jgi:hypothetical protein